MNKYRESLFHRLFEIGAIKEGEFTLSSGISSPIYIDMRRIISFPDVYQYVVDLMWQEMKDKEVDHVGGVPYAALPLASGIALLYHKSMLMPRKEVKVHGAARSVEGVFKEGDSVVLIEDVVTSGGSSLKAIEQLKNASLHVKDVVVFMDRQQGARQKLANEGIALHAVCTISEAVDALRVGEKIDDAAATRIHAFLKENQF